MVADLVTRFHDGPHELRPRLHRFTHEEEGRFDVGLGEHGQDAFGVAPGRAVVEGEGDERTLCTSVPKDW